MDTGWTATIELPPGKATTSTAVAATERIASAYNTSRASVVVEPLASGDASRARLMVLTRNPLEEIHPWPGPHLFDAAEGIAPIGVYPDGTQACYQFWRRGSGAVHGLLAGTSDAGKSRQVDMLLGYERHSGGLVCSWICDPQHGQSLPDWMDHVDFAARTAEEGIVLLRMAVAVMYARNDYLARVEWTDDRGRRRVGKAHFEPTPAMPLLSLTIEEAHAVLAYEEAAKLAEAIGKMGRKCGVALRLVVQVPLLAQLGNSTTLRDAVAGGNVIVLRTANRLSSPTVLPMPVDPAQLPRRFPDGSSTAGLGFVLGATDRQAPMRGYYDLDPFGRATAGETVPLDAISAPAAERVAHRAGIDLPDPGAHRRADRHGGPGDGHLPRTQHHPGRGPRVPPGAPPGPHRRNRTRPRSPAADRVHGAAPACQRRSRTPGPPRRLGRRHSTRRHGGVRVTTHDESLIALGRQAHRMAGEIRLFAELAETIGFAPNGPNWAEARLLADTLHGLAFACAFETESTDLLSDLTGRRWRRLDPPGGAG